MEVVRRGRGSAMTSRVSETALGMVSALSDTSVAALRQLVFWLKAALFA